MSTYGVRSFKCDTGRVGRSEVSELDEPDEPYFDPRIDAPEQATHFGCCLYYKIVIHGRVFKYVDGYWTKSEKPVSEIMKFENV